MQVDGTSSMQGGGATPKLNVFETTWWDSGDLWGKRVIRAITKTIGSSRVFGLRYIFDGDGMVIGGGSARSICQFVDFFSKMCLCLMNMYAHAS